MRTFADYLNMLDDPAPNDNPYPEFESEVFSAFKSMGVKPEELKDKKDRKKYKAWLAKQ